MEMSNTYHKKYGSRETHYVFCTFITSPVTADADSMLFLGHSNAKKDISPVIEQKVVRTH